MLLHVSALAATVISGNKETMDRTDAQNPMTVTDDKPDANSLAGDDGDGHHDAEPAGATTPETTKVVRLSRKAADDEEPDYSKEQSMVLLEEVGLMLDNSVLVYSISHLRQLVRDGKLEDPDNYLQTPIRLSDGLNLVEKHSDAIRENLGQKGTENYWGTLVDIKERAEERLESYGTTLEELDASGSMHGFIEIGDSNQEDELVYSILLDRFHKLVSVQFRGTTTTKDIAVDLKMFQWKVATNPLKDVIGQPNSMKIHQGFHDYLYNPNKHSASPCSKFDLIREQVMGLLEEKPGYKLYATGHSLGGALASLFAFSMAALDSALIKSPIVCISIASPKVGNSEFCKAFEYLESQGRLRHIRVVNGGDVIPMMPEKNILSSYVNVVFNPTENFQQTGIKVKLYFGEHGMKVSYNKKRRSFRFVGKRTKGFGYKTFLLGTGPAGLFNALKHHSCCTYLERIRANKENLRQISSDTLYELRQQGKIEIHMRNKKKEN